MGSAPTYLVTILKVPERSLITKVRQKKKPFHHNETGRECKGDMRVLAGLPQVAAEVLEGYFSGWGVPPEKYGVKTPICAPQPTAPELGKEPR